MKKFLCNVIIVISTPFVVILGFLFFILKAAWIFADKIQDVIADS